MKLTIDAEVLADFVSALLGPDSEIAVHDLSDPTASLCIIRNGVLSGRGIGAPATDLARRLAQECSGAEGDDFRVDYRSKAASGLSLRSSTLVFKDEDGQVRAMFCVNTDDSRYRRALDAVQALLPADLSQERHQENLSASVDDVGLDIMKAVLDQFEVDPLRLSPEEKSQVVLEFDRRGLFSIRGFVARAAQVLDISEPTLYRYLKQSRD
ncbi:helix-turn-helix transcriptional regulator [Paludibacterium purpuratum]|uniref:Putative transcriptional regulator YheO n=1 Tax=Paludibacterium purpuratum TaxID=1144873 RepID=A0A4R7AXU8_9NEIS|nr:PAS domain-containing protein [Paludibacterium purpuratum]TDR72499.1 putative transcriptional regulator YheO [Paludibacterium purpuratum]